jgi:hypothetical protein
LKGKERLPCGNSFLVAALLENLNRKPGIRPEPGWMGCSAGDTGLSLQKIENGRHGGNREQAPEKTSIEPEFLG